MACFLVPTTEAIIATCAKKVAQNKEKESGVLDAEKQNPDAISWTTKLSWLTTMLWGGAILLCLEHMWHGEVVLYPPFLTAMNSAADTITMLQEMSTVGVGMAVMVTAVWIVMVLAVDHLPAIRRAISSKQNNEGNVA